MAAISFFTCFGLFKFAMPSQNFGMNNNFRIIFLKIIIIIKVNFIKIYTKNTHIIGNKCDFTKMFIKKEHIIICA